MFVTLYATSAQIPNPAYASAMPRMPERVVATRPRKNSVRNRICRVSSPVWIALNEYRNSDSPMTRIGHTRSPTS